LKGQNFFFKLIKSLLFIYFDGVLLRGVCPRSSQPDGHSSPLPSKKL
jgi:hypothetical protein